MVSLLLLSSPQQNIIRPNSLVKLTWNNEKIVFINSMKDRNVLILRHYRAILFINNFSLHPWIIVYQEIQKGLNMEKRIRHILKYFWNEPLSKFMIQAHCSIRSNFISVSTFLDSLKLQFSSFVVEICNHLLAGWDLRQWVEGGNDS